VRYPAFGSLLMIAPLTKGRGPGPQASMSGRPCRRHDTFRSFASGWRPGRRDGRVYADQHPLATAAASSGPALTSKARAQERVVAAARVAGVG